MSKASDTFEKEIVTMVSKHIGESLPSTLPDWMLKEGIIPGAKIVSVPYVGVSICFGRISGKTGQDFLDIFTADDILTVARGFGSGDHVANCMYISNNSASNIQSLINNIEDITTESVNTATERFKVAHRPINPITEGTNRGKNVYTRFKPYQKLATKTVIRVPKELFKLGQFVEVEPSALNHNHILDDLEANYNIVIPRKGR